MKLLTSKESFSQFYTKKYTFVNDRQRTVDFVYVDRPPEHIICISCMYGCPVGCGFCKSGTKFFGKLSFDDIQWILLYIIKDKNLLVEHDIVFSFMGSGEPLLNYGVIAQSISYIRDVFPRASISLATSGVQIENLSLLSSQITYFPKIQLSLHSPFDKERQRLIPNTANLTDILSVLSLYHAQHKTKIILNYVVLEGVNDSLKHVQGIKHILDNYPFCLKINEYHDVASGYVQSKKRDEFITQLHDYGIFPKIYDTDGVDIGAACGQLYSEKMGDVLE